MSMEVEVQVHVLGLVKTDWVPCWWGPRLHVHVKY